MKSNIYSNIDTKRKIAGMLDYKTFAIFLAVIFIICSLSSLLNLGLKFTFISIAFFLPFGCVLLFCNTKNEDSLSVIKNVIRFYHTKKIYIKEYNNVKKDLKSFGIIFLINKENIKKYKNTKSILKEFKCFVIRLKNRITIR